MHPQIPLKHEVVARLRRRLRLDIDNTSVRICRQLRPYRRIDVPGERRADDAVPVGGSNRLSRKIQA